MITKEQAHIIAALVQSVRTAWDTRAIVAALAEVANLDLADVTHAAINAARDPEMRTPTSIGFLDAKHWRPTVRDTETADQRATRLDRQRLAAEAATRCDLCDDHGYVGVTRCDHNPETPERAKTGAALARAAIRPPRLPQIPPTGDAK